MNNNLTKKYYVQTGTSKTICQTRDAESAALWGVHQFLEERVDLNRIDWFDEKEIDNLELFQAFFELGDEVRVSEIGFGRSEAGWFDTADVMTQWQQLMIALSRMDISLDGE